VSEAAVVASGLGKRFGAVAALRGVDLEVARGGALALLGPNGAGKSTLLRLLAGLAQPSEGALTIDGRRARGGALRARVGFVGHATMLYPELSARENLTFAARLHGVPDPAGRAERLLAEDDLADLAGRPARALSRGTSQRVAIARALVHDPPLVLLDEPFTGLDRRAAGRLAERLARLRAEGRTLVVATHELRVLETLVDAALVLARGRVVHRAAHPELSVEALEEHLLAAAEAAA
jgi:heme exporter protein A